MDHTENPSDARIVAVFDQPSIAAFPEKNAPPLLWIDSDNRQYPVDLRVHWMLATGNTDAASDEERRWKESLLRDAGNALADVPPAFIDQVLNKRVSMMILLNQSGGNGLARACMLSAVRRVYKCGGSVQCMITQRAYSTAAHLTEPAFPRTALPHSDLLWHATHDGKGASTVQEVQDCTAANINMFRQTIQPQHIPEMEKRFDDADHDPQNTLNDVILSGQDLHRWDYVQELQPGIPEMEQKFSKNTSLPVNIAGWRTDPIARFFLRSRMEERALLHHGLRVEFYNDDPDKFLYNIPARQTQKFSDEAIDAALRDLRSHFGEYLTK